MSNYVVGLQGQLYDPTTGAYVGQLDGKGREQLISAPSAAQVAAGVSRPLGTSVAGGPPIGPDGKRYGPRGAITGSLKYRPRVLIYGHSIPFQSGIQFAGLNNSGAADLRSGATTLVASAAQTISDLTVIDYMTYTGEVESNVVTPAVSTSTSITLKNATKRMVRASASGTWSTRTTKQPTNVRQGLGIHTAALALNGWPVEVINPTVGYGGATMEQLVQDLSTYLPRCQPDFVFLHIIENSVTVPDDWATVMKPLLWQALEQCTRWGATPIVFSSVPSTSFNTSTMCANWDAQNLYINGGGMVADFPNAVPINCSDPWHDTTQDAGNKRQPLAGYADGDGLHPDGNHRFTCATATNNGAASVSAQLAAALPTFSGNRLAGALNANPSLSGTGGTASNLVGGSAVPASYTLTAEAGVTCTSSKNSDGSLNIASSIAGASNISSTRILLNNTAYSLPTNFGATSAMRVSGRFRINSQANMALLQVQIVFSGGETHSVGQLETNWMTDASIVGQIIDLETAAVPVPDGATTAQIQVLLRPQTLGSASGVTLNMDVFELKLKPASVA